MSSPLPLSDRRMQGAAFRRFCAFVWFSVTAFLPVLAILLSVSQARAGTPAVTPDEMQSGSLLLQQGDGHYVEAPRLATDVNIDVSGPTARARLTQAFENPGNGYVEALYVFPLPENSAVYSLKMIVGNRVIVADIKEKKAARAVYEQAKSEGKKAALVEQQRPNVFTNAVANIGPHEKVVVQIEYQQSVRLADGRFSLRVPLVVAPRYNPSDATPIEQSADLDGGWGKTQDKADARNADNAIHTPLQAPNAARVNPVTIAVDLKAGFPLGKVESLYHKVKIDAPDDATRRITLDGNAGADNVGANRDFVLEWQAAAGNTPNVGLFREHVGRDDYVLAYVTPPAVAAPQKQNREIVFVIDNSGSMGGASIEQARASLDYALSHLQPGDRFNVIRFDDTLTKLFDNSVAADATNIATARQYVSGLQAAGGTEMLPALQAALDDSHPGDGSLRQIVFLTDGEISNERQLLDTIAARRGRSRIFMVGIGSAPNTYLMSRAAELGRGTFTHIGSTGEVGEQMHALFDKLENPAVTNITARFSEKNVTLTPAILPDLYRGEPLVIAARMGTAKGTLTIDGMMGNRPWTITLPLDRARNAEGISKIWARRKIDDAEADAMLGTISQDAADARILRLALDHHLVTRLTSLVAVDATPSRPANAPLTVADIPLQLPAGWDYATLLGIHATHDAGRHASENHADAAQPVAQPAPSVPLPQTATPATLQMLLGLAALLIGLILFRFSRRASDRKVGTGFRKNPMLKQKARAA